MMFVAAFLCVILLTPIIIWVSFHKRLVTPINKRSSHHSTISPFGGVTFYIVLILSISIIQSVLGESIGYNIIAAISILFLVGLKDDLIHSTAKAKLMFQLMAGIITVCSPKLRIYGSFMGFQFDVLSSVVLSVCILVLIINAYNLIDGIDGLAGLIGIIICIFYAVIFYLIKDIFFSWLSTITMGTLCAFLKFNLSTSKLKIFMGNCGSLIIGLMIGLYTLRFLAHSISLPLPGHDHGLGYKLLLTCVILFIPLLDTSRIILIRLINGKNPFRADKNHVHHVLLNYGLSHLKTSILLSAVQIFIILMFFTISESVSFITLFGIVVLAFVVSTLLLRLIVKKSKTSINEGS